MKKMRVIKKKFVSLPLTQKQLLYETNKKTLTCCYHAGSSAVGQWSEAHFCSQGWKGHQQRTHRNFL